MARSLRIEFPGAHYHITSRGNERKYIYRTNKDREKFLLRTKKDWININEALNRFTIDHPYSKWADDAAYCRAIEFLFIRTGVNFFNKERIDTISDFLNDYPTFQIEEWTKRQFPLIEKYFSQEMPLDDSLSEVDKVRGIFFTHLIIQNCLNGDIAIAESTLKKLANEIRSEPYIENGKLIIESYSEMYLKK